MNNQPSLTRLLTRKNALNHTRIDIEKRAGDSGMAPCAGEALLKIRCNCKRTPETK